MSPTEEDATMGTFAIVTKLVQNKTSARGELKRRNGEIESINFSRVSNSTFQFTRMC